MTGGLAVGERGDRLAAPSREWRDSGHLVALAAVGLTCAPTTLPVYTIGVFVGPFEQAFGWSRGAIQAAILFSTGLGMIAAPMAGAMIARVGVRRTVIPGLAGLTLALVAASAMGGALWQLYAVYALMSLLGAGAGGVGWNTLLTRRFTMSRGLALGIGLSGTGLCSIVMPQVAAQSIAIWGWRGAYLALAAIAFLLVLPLCALLLPRDGPARTGGALPALPGMNAGAAVRSRRFWMLGASTAATYLAIGGAIPNLVPLLTDAGIAPARAASVLGVFGASVIIGRIAVGALVDRFWAPAVALAVLLAAAAGCVVLATGPGLVGAGIGAALLGMAAGTELDLLGYLVSRYFGLADFARIYGRLFVFVAAAAGIAPLLFGLTYDRLGSYAPAFGASAALLAAGAIGLLALGRYPVLD